MVSTVHKFFVPAIIMLASNVANAAALFWAATSASSGGGFCVTRPDVIGSPNPAQAQQVCADGLGNSSEATANAFGLWTIGARSSSVGGTNGLFFAIAQAEFEDTVVFHSADPNQQTALVNMGLTLAGVFGTTFGLGNGGFVALEIIMNNNNSSPFSIRYDEDSTNTVTCSTFGVSVNICNSTGGTPMDLRLFTGFITVPVNVPVPIHLVLNTNAGGSALVDYGHTLSLPVGSDVFNLPPGVTVDAPDGSIVNNRFTAGAADVPEPATGALAGLALAVLAWRRRAAR